MPETENSETPRSVDATSDSSLNAQRRRPDDSFAHGIFFGPDGLRAGWGLVIFLFLLFAMLTVVSSPLVQFAGRHTSSPSSLEPGTILLAEGLPALLVLLCTWIMSRIEHRPLSCYGLAPARWLPRMLTGIVWGIAFLSLLVLALRAAGLLVFDGRTLSGAGAFHYGALWVLGFFAVSLFEETFFRGYVLLTLSRGISGIFGSAGIQHRDAIGFWTAAALLSFGFGLVHTSNAGESPIGLLSAGMIGLVFCLSLWRTGSLWWAIGMHAAWDWAESYLYGTADSGNVVAGHLFATHPVGQPVLSGGATGPEGSILMLPIALLVAIVVWITLRPRSLPCWLRRDPETRTALDLP